MHRATPLFEDYAEHHQTSGNKWCHRVGIPLIMLSLLGMLSVIHIPIAGLAIDAGMIVIALGTAYYLWLGWRIAMAMLLLSVILYLAGAAIPLGANLAIFIAGWILQFIGHGVFEKRSPAFLRNLVHLLVGPMWIANDLVPLAPEAESGSAGPERSGAS